MVGWPFVAKAALSCLQCLLLYPLWEAPLERAPPVLPPALHPLWLRLLPDCSSWARDSLGAQLGAGPSFASTCIFSRHFLRSSHSLKRYHKSNIIFCCLLKKIILKKIKLTRKKTIKYLGCHLLKILALPWARSKNWGKNKPSRGDKNKNNRTLSFYCTSCFIQING